MRGEKAPREVTIPGPAFCPGQRGGDRAVAFSLPSRVRLQSNQTFTHPCFLHNQTSLWADEVFFNKIIYLKKSPNKSFRRFTAGAQVVWE